MDRAPSGQENEDWHSSKSTTLERAKYLLETGLYADCEFLVGGSDGSDQEVYLSTSFNYLTIWNLFVHFSS